MPTISDRMDMLLPLSDGTLATLARLPYSATRKPGPTQPPRTPCTTATCRAHRRQLAKLMHRHTAPPKIDPVAIRQALDDAVARKAHAEQELREAALQVEMIKEHAERRVAAGEIPGDILPKLAALSRLADPRYKARKRGLGW